MRRGECGVHCSIVISIILSSLWQQGSRHPQDYDANLRKLGNKNPTLSSSNIMLICI